MTPNHEYVEAYFTDNHKKTIRSYWRDTTQVGDVLEEMIIEADPDDASFQMLLQSVSIDEIHSNTWYYIRNSQEALKQEVVAIAKENGWLYNLEDGGRNSFHSMFVDFLFSEAKDAEEKEKLFFLKLELFEKDQIKSCKDKELKKALRRSTTVVDAVDLAIQILKKNSC